MRRIRANAIAILTVAWILGTLYYLWQDNKPHTSPSSVSQTRTAAGKSHGQRAAAGRVEIHRDDRTIPLIVSDPFEAKSLMIAREEAGTPQCLKPELQGSVCCMLMRSNPCI